MAYTLILVMITKDTKFTQKMLLPESESKGSNEKLSATLPINVSNHLELYTLYIIDINMMRSNLKPYSFRINFSGCISMVQWIMKVNLTHPWLSLM